MDIVAVRPPSSVFTVNVAVPGFKASAVTPLLVAAATIFTMLSLLLDHVTF